MDKVTDNRYRIAELEKTVSSLANRIAANHSTISESILSLKTNHNIISESLLGLKARLDKLDRLEKLLLDMESRIALLEKNMVLAFETINNHEGS